MSNRKSYYIRYFTLCLAIYNKYGKNTFAKLKNTKKPNTSVAVVKNIVDESAGSIFILFKSNGIKVPHTPEIIKLIIIAKNTIIPK